MVLWSGRDPGLCGYISCEKKAVWRHLRGAGIFCEEHMQNAQDMFGGILTFERIEQEVVSDDQHTMPVCKQDGIDRDIPVLVGHAL